MDITGKEIICCACRAKIHPIPHLFCGTCHARAVSAKLACPCRDNFIMGTIGAYSDQNLHNLAKLLKFKGVLEIADYFGEILAEVIGRHLPQNIQFVIIPVPLSPQRLRLRGYNQSEQIARALLLSLAPKNIKASMTPDALKRIRDTKPQTETKTRNERLKNIKGAFCVSLPNKIKDEHILLVDDVVTTGATVRAAIAALKSAKPKSITVLAALSS